MNSKLYIVFLLNEEEYGLEIACTQEIIRFPEQLTQIPNMPSFVEGIINLRGKVIPIINLKKRFYLKQEECGTDCRLMIINSNNTTFAVTVDDVSEILNIEEEAIEQLSNTIAQMGMVSLKGIGKVDNRMILIVDETKLETDVFLNGNEMEERK